MIQKTQRMLKRRVRSGYPFDNDKYMERVLVETWWLLGFIPLYSRQKIEASTV